MSDTAKPVSEAFGALVDLCEALGVENIGALSGPWQQQVDQNWTVAINGRAETTACAPPGCMGCDIPGFHAAIWWCGWLAGLLHPFGGMIAAGAGANEDTLIAALREATSARRRVAGGG